VAAIAAQENEARSHAASGKCTADRSAATPIHNRCFRRICAQQPKVFRLARLAERFPRSRLMPPAAHARADLRVLFASRMVRLFACGLLAVVLALYLDAIGLDAPRIGLLLTLTFLGDAAISLWLTTRADRIGRRATLRFGAALMILGGAGMALTDNFVLLTLAATIGVISPTGAEVGPFLAVEQACLAHVVEPRERTRMFAWYHVAGFTMSALGALAGGQLAHALQSHGWSPAASYRVLLWIFAGCGAALALLSLKLGTEVEPHFTSEESNPLVSSPISFPRQRGFQSNPIGYFAGMLGLGEARGLVLRLSALFALDSFGGGFCVQSFLAWWFHQKFGASEAALGTVFFGTNLLSGLSALAAVPIARRIGLVNTMVWTHLPSSMLLMLVPLMPNFGAAMVMLWLRNCISQMDVPTRGSYVNAVVPPSARAAANGVTTTAKQIGQSLAPMIAAPLLGSATLVSLPFWICGGTKIIYDLLLWRAFRRVKPPEEM
jgi:MFS family permease